MSAPSEADVLYLEDRLAILKKPKPIPGPQDRSKPSCRIPAGSAGNVSCVSNADYIQRLSVKIGNDWTIFEGRGENSVMTIKDHPDQTSRPFTRSNVDQDVFCIFQYNDGSGFKDSNVVPVKTYHGGTLNVQFVIGSEDWSDNDVNDTMMTVLCNLPQTGGRQMLQALSQQYNFALVDEDEDEE